MHTTLSKRLRPIILAALAAGGFTAPTQAADLIAFWDFERVEADGTSIKAATGNFTGTMEGGPVLTAAGEGRPKGGGKGFSVGVNNPGKLILEATGDANPMNLAAVNDQVSVVVWQKNDSNVNSSSFWAVSESAGGGRGFQFHIPWSNGNIYFDTTGCCSAPSQRLDKGVVGVFPDHDWLTWHHYAFIKNGESKQIWVDGLLLAEQTEGVGPLTADYTKINIGSDGGGAYPNAVIDDFAIFKGALTEAEIKKFAAGNSPGVPPLDTDKDGMPDNWETEYGFNPNDAKDAALDFDKDGVTNLDEFKAGSDPIDVTKPSLLSATGSATFNTITLTFSEALDPTTSTTLANYSVSPSLAVTAATVKKNVVTLTTAAQAPGATAYTVTASKVTDGSKNVIGTPNSASFYSYILATQGVMKISVWKGINGTPVQNLLDDPRYPATPDYTAALFSFNSRDALPSDSLENYGATMEGYLTPTESGRYRFFDYSDDASQLFLSTDDKEANLVQIAEQTGCCTFFTEPDSALTSEPIALVAGKKYFVRLIYKEGGGGDYGQVAWRKEGDATPAGSLKPIPGKFLSSAVGLASPPEGAFVTQSPGVNQKGVSPAGKINIAHRDGKTAWTDANVSLKFDGAAVKPTITKDGTVISLSFKPDGLFASGSVHTIDIAHLDAGGKATSTSWSFTSGTYNGTTTDKVAGYPGLLLGASAYTADALGHTLKAGDKAIDTTKKGGPVAVYSEAFLAGVNAATAKDELTVSFWQKKHDTADSSAFTVDSPTAGNNRNFHAHAPWSNQNVYFDTVGCCDGTTQRITADISTFGDYTTGDPRDNLWWTTQWHHWVFTKKGSAKNIFIDGKLFLSGDSTNPLKTDSQAFYMGSGSGGNEQSHGLIDDFAVFGTALSEADALALKNGTLPTALAGKGLIAFWDFNSAPVASATISIAAGGKISYTGVLFSSDLPAGPYTAVTGATSPYTTPSTVQKKFYRSGN